VSGEPRVLNRGDRGVFAQRWLEARGKSEPRYLPVAPTILFRARAGVDNSETHARKAITRHPLSP
jgi:hypothetical protein